MLINLNLLFHRLLDNTETLERGGRKLNQGRRLLAETESIGVEVLSDLGTQRESIQRARNRVRLILFALYNSFICLI